MDSQHVRVQANVVDAKTGRGDTTNDFRFTFSKDDNHGVPRVIPNTYQGKKRLSLKWERLLHDFLCSPKYAEAMLWLEGKRALEMGRQIRGNSF